jgi:hypothetical protein
VEVIGRHGVVVGQVNLGAAGMAELEAMACARPVVCRFTFDAAYPEPPPFVRAAEGDEIAAAVIRLADDAELRQKTGEEGRAWIERYHELDAVAERVERAALDVLAGRRERSRVLILGLPYFGKMLEDILGARGWTVRYRPHPGRDIRAWARLAWEVARADVVYLISSRLDRRSPQALLARFSGRPIVIHWVGRDVDFALEEFRTGRASQRLIRRATHLADAPWLVDELVETGIRAEYVPLPVPGMPQGDPPPLPQAFRVLLYYPEHPLDREVYDYPAMIALAREFPGAAFRLIPSPPETLPEPPPPNVEATGWVTDMDAVYRETTVYVRLTNHDGTSFMAIEALSRGRYVIWTFPLAGAVRASGFDEVAAVLRELLEQHERGELGLNLAGRAAVMAEFDFERLAGKLDLRLRTAVKRKFRTPR